MNLLKNLKKYKNFIAYIFFGVCTTILNILSYRLFYYVLGIPNVPSTVFAWLLAVLFAFVTNKNWVFDSKIWTLKIVFPELAKFIICRLGTGIIDVFIMWFSVDKMKMNPMVLKLISNIIVIALNYIASKFIIFIKNNKIGEINEK